MPLWSSMIALLAVATMRGWRVMAGVRLELDVAQANIRPRAGICHRGDTVRAGSRRSRRQAQPRLRARNERVVAAWGPSLAAIVAAGGPQAIPRWCVQLACYKG